jgi:hypothetical protein
MFSTSGFEIQEDQLKATFSVSGIFEPDYGREPESIYGVVESLAEDVVTINNTM